MSPSVVKRGTAAWRRTGQAQHLALRTAAACALLMLPTLALALLDPRSLDGVNLWLKPLKFQFAFALHWLTLAWLTPLVGGSAQPRLTGWLRVAAVATAVELAAIMLQAGRGRASHFNTTTLLDAVVYYGVMAGAVALLMAATLAMAWLLWRHPADPHRGPAWQGAVWGLGLGGLLTVVVAAPLAAGIVDGPGPWVGGIKHQAAGLPLLHWSTTGGDLRVPHFVATHLTQALPLLGWALERARVERPARWLTLAAVVGAGLVLAAFLQAAAGSPVWAAPPGRLGG